MVRPKISPKLGRPLLPSILCFNISCAPGLSLDFRLYFSTSGLIPCSITSYDYGDLIRLILPSLFAWVVELNDDAVVSINNLLKTHH